MASTKDLIDAIASGKSATIQATFDQLMAEKVSVGIEAYRQAVIDNTFNPELHESEEDDADDSSINEANMSASDKKTAMEVHKVLKSGDSVGEVYGAKIKQAHNDLKRKYGSDWRKKAGINEGESSEDLQLDELSGATLGSYIQKAHTDKRKKFDHEIALDASPKVKAKTDQRRDLVLRREYTKDGRSKHHAKIDKLEVDIQKQKKKEDPQWPMSGARGAYKRVRGIEKAVSRLTTGNKLTEGEIAEELQLEDYSLEEIQDFMVSEEFEALDELSKNTLKAYVQKAAVDTGAKAYAGGFENGKANNITKAGTKSTTKAFKRALGISSAASKLAK